jgi:isopenicillin N synthase-like dioxygenase
MLICFKTQANSLFEGYNVLGGEITAKKVDWREQIDISTEHPLPTEGAPQYHNLRAPNLWPTSNLLPEFRPTFEEYIKKMSKLSTDFTSLIAEALDLPPSAFDRFFDADQQHKLKIVRYPDLNELKIPPPTDPEAKEEIQGVGPHKDSMLTSYLLQASHHKGLQAQNLNGQWIDCPPIPGTLVVAIGLS